MPSTDSQQPLFSVVTIVRNNLEGLRTTAKSVEAQSCKNYEWLIIDGASTDNTIEYVNRLRDIASTVVSEPDKGIYDAMNKGLKLATGRYVIFLNAGDAFASSDSLAIVETEYNSNQKNVAMIICAAEFQLTNGRYFIQKPRPIEYIWHSLPTSHQAMFFRSDLHKSNLFNPAYTIAADYDAIARMYKIDSTALYIDHVIALVWRGTESNSVQKPMIGISDMAKVQKAILQLPGTTILYSAVRRFLPLIALHLLEIPVLSKIVYKGILFLRPERIKSGSN